MKRRGEVAVLALAAVCVQTGSAKPPPDATLGWKAKLIKHTLALAASAALTRRTSFGARPVMVATFVIQVLAPGMTW